MFQAPNPISALQPANLMSFISGPTAEGQTTCFKDRKGCFWAHQAGDGGDVTNYVFEFSYPHQPTFDYIDNMTPPEVGTPIVWLANYVQRDDGYLGAPSAYPVRDASDTGGVDYTFIVRWPDSVPKLYVNQTLYEAKNGLPEMRRQLSVRIAYEQSQRVTSERSVKLIDPTVRQTGSLKEIPDGIKWYLDYTTGKRHFDHLPPFMQQRFVFNPVAKYDLAHGKTEELELTGTYREVIGIDPYLWLNVMDARSRQLMTDSDFLFDV